MSTAPDIEVQAAPDQQALAVLPPAERAAVAIQSSAAEQHLRALVVKSAEIKNVVDKHGREEAHRAAMGLKNARVAVVNTGKAAREDATAFQRAVVAEVDRLAAITADEEARLFGLRDAFDKKLEAEKAKRERIDAERKAMHRAEIDLILTLPARCAFDSSAALTEALQALAARDIGAEGFEEFADEARAAVDTAADALIKLRAKALEREAAEQLERQRREAAEKQAEADRQELARVKAEQAERERKEQEAQAERDRQAAADRAAAAQRERELAEQQAAVQRQQDQLRAEQEKQQLAMEKIRQIQNWANLTGTARRLDDELEAAQAFVLDADTFGAMLPMAQMAQNMAVLALRQSYRARLEIELPAAYEEALAENARLDAECVAVFDQVHVIVQVPPLPAAEPEVAPEAAAPAPALDESPTDAEIVQAVADKFGMSYTDAVARVAAIDFELLALVA
jgi:hypothetical protein